MSSTLVHLWTLLFILNFSQYTCENDFKIVTTDSGLVKGLKSDDGKIFRFYGIPYATAPSGDDKFQAPLPPPSWLGVFDATKKNVVCPQRLNNQIGENYNMLLDCLHINIFVPNNKGENLPVLMYIHGGAYQQGYGNEISPDNLVNRGVIVANINYRVGVYGFLCLGTKFAPGNAGLKDQVAALRWIKRNIAKFGGDPNNIAVAGNSAGSSSVEFLILSKMASGLLQKGISESASTISSWAVTKDPVELAERYARQFGVNTGRNISRLEEFYKGLTLEDFTTSFNETTINDIGFVPCVEKAIDGVEMFLQDQPIDIIKSGNYNKVDYITGFTSMEGIHFLDNYDSNKKLIQEDFSNFLPLDLTFDNECEKEDAMRSIKDFYFPNGDISYENYANFFTDSIFSYAITLSARLHRENNLTVYFYQFSFNGAIRLPHPKVLVIPGPGHVTQAMYVQNFSYGIGYDRMSTNDYLIQDRMTTLWYNFLKYGKPVPEATELLPVEWTAYADDRNYLNIDLEMNAQRSLLQQRMSFWDQIYDKYKRKNYKMY